MKTMKNTMKKLATRLLAGVICALLALAFAVPTYAAGKACAASLNVKNCVSTLDSVSSNGTDLTLTGVLRVLNSGQTPGAIVSVVANLQTKDTGGQYQTIATITSCTGLSLIGSLTVPGGPDVCGGANQSNINYIATFPGVVASLVSGKQARLELQVTYDGGPNGSALDSCGAGSQCNGLRTIAVRFGFVVP